MCVDILSANVIDWKLCSACCVVGGCIMSIVVKSRVFMLVTYKLFYLLFSGKGLGGFVDKG